MLSRASIVIVFMLLFFTSCEKVVSLEDYVETGGVHVGSVILNTQTEVDEFVSHEYSSIDGDLVIDSKELVVPAGDMGVPLNSRPEIIKAPYEVEQEDPIIDLSNFNSVEEISGYVSINYNSSLESLSGLVSLKEVGEGIFIHDNKNLKELNSFEKLKSIGGGLIIRRNKSLLTLNGFNSLKSIGGSVSVTENGIYGIIGFNQLTTINGSELIIAGNDNLLRIDGFNVLNQFEIDSEYDLFKILISSNKELVVFKGLSALDTLQGEIGLSSNDKLKRVEAFQHLKVVEGIGGRISIQNCELLEDFSFLSSLLEVNNLWLSENASLSNLNFLNKDIDVGSFDIKHNPILNDFCRINELIDSVRSFSRLIIWDNLYNPHESDFKNGNCSN